jgi:SAM-dependent methyltransferase
VTLRDSLFYGVGIGFLMMAKAKNILGFSSPKPFDISEAEKCIDYDIGVVENWLKHLRRYTNGTASLTDKNVLELGPGSDLGTGLCLLAKGCGHYHACDVHDLMRSTPDSFYEQLFVRLQRTEEAAAIEHSRRQWQEAKAGRPSRLRTVVREDFDIAAAFGDAGIDLVFSQAAFEHFDDIDATFAQLTQVCRSGAILVAEVDLKTHSRWIRDKDPNNIYRYPAPLYDLFRFRASPNRLRPFRYRDSLEHHGWTDVDITPLARFPDAEAGYSGMHRAFTGERNQMEFLSIMLCARKGGADPSLRPLHPAPLTSP